MADANLGTIVLEQSPWRPWKADDYDQLALNSQMGSYAKVVEAYAKINSLPFKPAPLNPSDYIDTDTGRILQIPMVVGTVEALLAYHGTKEIRRPFIDLVFKGPDTSEAKSIIKQLKTALGKPSETYKTWRLPQA